MEVPHEETGGEGAILRPERSSVTGHVMDQLPPSQNIELGPVNGDPETGLPTDTDSDARVRRIDPAQGRGAKDSVRREAITEDRTDRGLVVNSRFANGRSVTTLGRSAREGEEGALVPAYRIAPRSGARVRDEVARLSQELFDFISPLESQVKQIARTVNENGVEAPTDGVAELVLDVIRRIAHRETGLYTLEPNLPALFHALFAGGVESAIIEGLVQRAQSFFAQVTRRDKYQESGSRLEQYDVRREVAELTMFLKWYVQRKTSLLWIEMQSADEEENGASVAGGDQRDALFGFQVMHDHQVFGNKGCYVGAGLRLIGHDGDPLWFRVTVRHHGRPVAAQREWRDWVDSASLEPDSAVTREFCSLVPIRPNAQRLVIDDVRAFIPYAALDLPPGKVTVEIVVAVVSEDGHVLLGASRPEGLSVPKRESSKKASPSPHAAEMWPHDVVSGDRIIDLKARSGYKQFSGWERMTISVSFDLELAMHAGESVILECRFLDSHGRLVELSSLCMPTLEMGGEPGMVGATSYRFRRLLHPRTAWASLNNQNLDIPLEFLLLEPGRHDLTCELVVLSADDRVLCGDMSVITVEVPDYDGATKSSGKRRNTDIELQGFDVDASGSFRQREAIRIDAVLAPRRSLSQVAELASGRVGELFAPYRVLFSLEREDGVTLLQAFSDDLGISFRPVTCAVCLEGHPGFSEHRISANFIKDEVLGWAYALDGKRQATKHRLFARIRATTLYGDPFLDEVREFYVKTTPSNMADSVVHVTEPAPMIVDAVFRRSGNATKGTAKIAINVPCALAVQNRYSLCVDVRCNGTSERITVPIQGSQMWLRQGLELVQIPHEIECAVPASRSGVPQVVASITSALGSVLQQVDCQVESSALMTQPEEPRRADAAPVEPPPQRPEAEARPRGFRGLFGRK